MKSPQLRASASRAKATAPIGKTRRTKRVSRTTTAIFGATGGACQPLLSAGARSSHRAMPSKTPANAARRRISLGENGHGARAQQPDGHTPLVYTLPKIFPTLYRFTAQRRQVMVRSPRAPALDGTRAHKAAPGWPPPPWGFAVTPGSLPLRSDAERAARILTQKWWGEPVPRLARFS